MLFSKLKYKILIRLSKRQFPKMWK